MKGLVLKSLAIAASSEVEISSCGMGLSPVAPTLPAEGVTCDSRGNATGSRAPTSPTLKGSHRIYDSATTSGSGSIFGIDPGALPPATILAAFSVLKRTQITGN